MLEAAHSRRATPPPRMPPGASAAPASAITSLRTPLVWTRTFLVPARWSAHLAIASNCAASIPSGRVARCIEHLLVHPIFCLVVPRRPQESDVQCQDPLATINQFGDQRSSGGLSAIIQHQSDWSGRRRPDRLQPDAGRAQTVGQGEEVTPRLHPRASRSR